MGKLEELKNDLEMLEEFLFMITGMRDDALDMNNADLWDDICDSFDESIEKIEIAIEEIEEEIEEEEEKGEE